MHALLQRTKVIHLVNGSSNAALRFVEYAYYFSGFYSIMGAALGLQMELVGAGMIAALAAFCVMCLGSRAMTVYAPLALPLGFAISFLVIQLTLHGESLMQTDDRQFVNWILNLIIVQSLTLRRGFLHRFARVTFLIGLAMLPYLQLQSETSSSGPARAELDRIVGYGNSNDLAAWFGFGSVYFII